MNKKMGLLDFLTKLEKASSMEELTSMIGDDEVKLEFRAIKMLVPGDEQAMEQTANNYLRHTRRHVKELGVSARECLELVRDHEPCGHENHRFKPEHGKDWQPVDNMMSTILSAFQEERIELTKMWQSVGLEACRRAGMIISPEMNLSLAKAAQRVSMLEAILMAHFNLVRYGRDDFADLHIDRLVAYVEDGAAKELRKINQELNKHEDKGKEGG